MIVIIKTLDNKRYGLNIEPANTVHQIKEKIHNDLKLGEPESQKLIHHGKILKDDQTAESAGVKEKDFLVFMVCKEYSFKIKKRVPKPKPAQPAASASSSAASSSDSGASGDNASALLTGAKLDEVNPVIANLMGMGFERDQCAQALRAALYNPDRAVEYLLNVESPNPANLRIAPTRCKF